MRAEIIFRDALNVRPLKYERMPRQYTFQPVHFFPFPTTGGREQERYSRLVFMSGLALTSLEKVVDDVLKGQDVESRENESAESSGAFVFRQEQAR